MMIDKVFGKEDISFCSEHDKFPGGLQCLFTIKNLYVYAGIYFIVQRIPYSYLKFVC